MILNLIVFILAAALLTNGVTIKCNFQDYAWNIVGMRYSCYGATIISDRNPTKVIDITGNHESGKTNADVKSFGVQSGHQHMNRIPKGIEKFFPHLLLLAWKSGNLTTLTAGDLKPFPELQELFVDGNKLASLDGNLFKYTPKLRYIDVSYNQIEHVGYDLLDGLNNLTNANFNINRCVNTFAYSQATMQVLMLKLQDQCPPLAITKPEHCPIECVEFIESLEEEIQKQTEKNEKLIEEIARHREENARQNKKTAALIDAIQEMEKQIRELSGRP